MLMADRRMRTRDLLSRESSALTTRPQLLNHSITSFQEIPTIPKFRVVFIFAHIKQNVFHTILIFAHLIDIE